VRLAIQAILAGLVVGLLSAGVGWTMSGDSQIGSSEAQVGALLLLGSPAFAIGTAALAGALGYLMGRSARARSGRRSKRRSDLDLPRLDGVPHQLRAKYRFRPGTIDRVARQAETELAALLRKRPGFVSYEFVKTTESEGVSISTWSSREQAEAAVETSAAWANARIAPLVRSMESHVGAVGAERQSSRVGSIAR
jgi:heme-degrading monooxygenase HmoA